MTDIYHITSLKNLPSILQIGGLWCDSEMHRQKISVTNIAHQDIKDRRTIRQVPYPPRGTIADYVPFYFAPRSPMLYTINRGNVVGYEDGQATILHLVSTAELVNQSGLDFSFTDGHAIVEISQFYSDLADLNHIDWNIMNSIYWHDTIDDGDRKRRRQAEFLVHHFFPFSLIQTIGVSNHTIASRVNAILRDAEVKPNVQVIPTWYY
jgi:hypothetical protein